MRRPPLALLLAMLLAGLVAGWAAWSWTAPRPPGPPTGLRIVPTPPK